MSGIFASRSLTRSNDFRNPPSFARGVRLPISTPACIPTATHPPTAAGRVCGLRRFAAEAWRRADAGELTVNELYCYQACKTRLRREREEL